MKTASLPKRRFGLAFRLGLLLIGGSFLIFFGVFCFNFTHSRRLIREGMRRDAHSLAVAKANEIYAVLAAVEQPPRYLARLAEMPDLTAEQLQAMIRQGLESNPNVFGSTAAFAPRAFDARTNYFAPYCYRDNGRIEFIWLGGANYHYFDHDWFLIPRELDTPCWSEPFFDEGGVNRLMATYSVPFYRRQPGGGREFRGVATADITLEWLQKLASEIRVLETGYAFLLSRNGVFLTHPDTNLVMRSSIFDMAEENNLPELRRIARDMLRGRSDFVRLPRHYRGRPCWYYYTPVPSVGWSLVVVFPEHELYAEVYALQRKIAAIALLGFCAFFLLTLNVLKRTARPIQRISALAEKIAGRDLQAVVQRLPVFERENERLRTREYWQLGRAFISMTRSLHALLAQVRESGLQVAGTSAEIAASARQLEATATEQAASTREVSNCSADITTRARNLVQTMGEIAAAAASTGGLALEGRGGLGNMESSMQRLTDATMAISAKLSAISRKAENIRSIVPTINKVADQTNLLSLNAAIEAEKAGEYGVGFAVVAREIRRLADQTALATQDIERMVKEMLSAVSSGVMEMDKFVDQVRRGGDEVRTINGRLGGIIDQVGDLTPRVEVINQSMQAQTAGAEQISEAMAQLSAAAGQIRESLQEFNKVADQLNVAAQSLSQEVAKFKLD